MQKYKYVAVNLQKKKFTGYFIAENESHLARQLAEQNLYLISAKPVSDGTVNSFFTVSGRLKPGELTTFSRQFAIMVNSGVSILNTLSILKSQSFSGYFRRVLEVVYEDVKTGVMLSEAMKKHKRVFPEFFRSMVYVGEVSGALDKVLTSLADYYETDTAIKRKSKGAMIYPLLLLLMLVGIVVLMMVFVIPTFRNALVDLDIEMPALTMAIYNISDFFLQYWKELIIAVAAVAGIVWLLSMTQKGKYFFDMMRMKTPFIGKVNENLVTARFARGFGLLLSSGLDVLDAMEVICVVLGNRYVEKKFRAAIEDVRQGMSLTMAFETHRLFPDILIQMVSVGEKTGTVDEVLLRSCSFFDAQVETALSALTTVLQPIMLIIMGVVVAVMFIAVYSPILSIMTGLDGTGTDIPDVASAVVSAFRSLGK